MRKPPGLCPRRPGTAASWTPASSTARPGRDAAIDLRLAVAYLHQRGWVHGDLQPDHAIHTKTGVQLIDCTWAASPDLAATLWYAATGTWPHDYRAAGIVSGLDIPGPEIRRLVVHDAAAQEGE
ncbi:hypothetical protein [Streptomyces sp. NPDC058548]|uniref:hypothetical protein n=1 Tax=Streptomyces sp. NPDC058548 TaxID=3346545 RepID=UPI0036540133